MASKDPIFTILVLTDSGCEEACATEIARFSRAKTTIRQNIVALEGTLLDAAKLSCRLLTARRVLVELIPMCASIEELEAGKPNQALLDAAFPDTLTFKADGEVLSLSTTTPQTTLVDEESEDSGEEGSEEELNDSPVDEPELFAETEEVAPDHVPKIIPQELIEAIGGWMHGLGRKVNLSKPDLIIYGIATNQGISVGIDVVGRTLAKREYRIMLSRRSIKATIAAATIIYAGAKEKEAILDPFADDGSIAVEIAMYLSRTSPLLHARGLSFEKFPALAGQDWSWRKERKDIATISAYASSLQEMKAVRTNAKLAGVEKDIHATKVTVEWMETKVGENSTDRIITAPMQSGKSVAPQRAQKHLDELFYQAEFVLKKGKTMTCLSEKPSELLPAAEKYGFSVLSERRVLMGKRLMTIITFTNNKRKEDKEA